MRKFIAVGIGDIVITYVLARILGLANIESLTLIFLNAILISIWAKQVYEKRWSL